MTTEISKNTNPPLQYYEDPYLMSADEASDYSTIPLLPVEAHTILVKSVGGRLSEIDKEALKIISESEESDFPIDYKEVRRRIVAERETDND